MVMPLAGRVAAAVAGGLLVLAAVSSVTVTLIVSRAAKSRLARWVDRMVDWAYEQVAARVGDYWRRDQLRATQAAVVLLAQLAAWLIVAYALLAVLDSAALFLALSPEAAPVVPARLCLRGGFRCFNRIARVMGFDIPEEPGPDAGTTLTYAEFLDAVGRMREAGFRSSATLPRPGRTSPDGVNYERAAYAVAAAVYAVPALWSGPRCSRSRRSRPSAPDAATRPGNKDAPGGIRVSRKSAAPFSRRAGISYPHSIYRIRPAPCRSRRRWSPPCRPCSSGGPSQAATRSAPMATKLTTTTDTSITAATPRA